MHQAPLASSAVIALLAALPVTSGLVHQRPNPPTWPPSVQVFGPKDDPAHVEAAVQRAFELNGGQNPINHGEFSKARFAFLFKPGKYSVNIPVGYYTQVLGLGGQPGDVIFDAERGIYCEESNKRNLFGSLSTFWRGAENFRTRGDMLWATSQATPIRRAIVDGDLYLSQYEKGVGMGYSSGGFVGNIRVGGTLQAASQQQYCTRNAQIGDGTAGGVWNMVYIGTTGAPQSHCGLSKSKDMAGSVTVDSTPLIAEKPFISMDAHGKYHLHVPLVKRDRVGTDFSWGSVIGFEKVFVARPSDSAAAINQWLRSGFHVVLTPGIYHLNMPLVLATDNQVLLGIGFATLIAPRGLPAVQVGNVDGVRLSGILIEANSGKAEALVEWGDGTHEGSPFNPSFMHDVFVRVGGSTDPNVGEVSAKVMVKISSGFVIGDNVWLWRADHGVSGLVKYEMNPCDTGLIVTGRNVTMYGLAVEHTLKDLVQWSGEGGETYFYQSELPYDVTPEYGAAAYAGYRVNNTVRDHHAFGVGVYHYFRDNAVTVKHGIAVPAWLENSIESPLSVYLNGKGTMLNIMNERGGLTSHDTPQARWLCSKGPTFPYAPPTTTTATTTASTTTLTRTGTTLTTTTKTATGTRTQTTTSTTTNTRTTTTATSTRTTVTSTMTTTTTTTPEPLLLWGLLSGHPAFSGWLPWLLGLLLLQTLTLTCYGLRACCIRKPRAEEGKLPLTSVLSFLSRRSNAGDRNRVHFVDNSPTSSMHSPPSFASRALSFTAGAHSLLGSLSPGPSETTRLSLSPRVLTGTPGRRGAGRSSRTLSMGSVAESGFSESPGGAALLSPCSFSGAAGQSPLFRPHGNAR